MFFEIICTLLNRLLFQFLKNIHTSNLNHFRYGKIEKLALWPYLVDLFTDLCRRVWRHTTTRSRTVTPRWWGSWRNSRETPRGVRQNPPPVSSYDPDILRLGNYIVSSQRKSTYTFVLIWRRWRENLHICVPITHALFSRYYAHEWPVSV